MPVPTLISQLSTTASLNSPDGAVDVPSSIDDYLRAHAAFIAQLYTNTVTAFTTGGTSTAFTGAPNPPITSNTAGQRFMATLHAAPTGPFTLSVSGQPAMNVVYWDTNLGSWQIAGVAQAKQWYPCDVVSDGIQWILLNPVPIRTALMAVLPGAYTVSKVLTRADLNKLVYYWGSGAATFTLPAARVAGDTVTISAINTGTCTVAGTGGETIYARGIGGATSTYVAPGESISLVFDGTNWVQAAGCFKSY